MQDFCSNSPWNGLTVMPTLPQGRVKAGGGCLWLAGLWQRHYIACGQGMTEMVALSALALPTCELRTEDLWVVDDVLPELLELGYPCNVLQQPHKVPADHEAVHELGKGEEKISFTVYLLLRMGKGEGTGGQEEGKGGTVSPSTLLLAPDDSLFAQYLHSCPWQPAPLLKLAGSERQGDRREGQQLF